ncbi:MAG: DUF368 domain-containing protein [Clostridia bacterium]|nr:DUF368 domain-containing protein [Clostridia bacterium]
MKLLFTALKGVAVGIGGVAPGLSGSVMLLILGLYERAVEAVSTLFKSWQDFKRNLLFLLPLAVGMVCGVFLFGKVVDFALEQIPFATRYLFLGLVLGTLPLFWKSVTKNGFPLRYIFFILGALALGIFVFYINRGGFPPVTQPNFWQSALLGLAVAGSSIIPGVDSAVILSSLGLYELYVGSIADLNFSVLLPAALGVVVGVFLFSILMHLLIKRFYTATFSVILGLFLSIIPKVLTEECVILSFGQGALAVGLVLFGFVLAFYLGDIQKNNERLRRLFGKRAD